MDLKDVTLVNQTAVEFLARCESDYIKLQKCPSYIRKWVEAFLQGRSAPDFAAMDFEVDFKGRATEKDLTDLGRAQMGF